MAASIRVLGTARASSTLREAGVQLEDLDEATEAAGRRALTAIRPLVPVRTGRLAGSLVARDGAVTTDLDYGPPVHQGVPSRGQAAQPFGTTGMDNAEPGITLLYLERIGRILSRVKGV